MQVPAAWIERWSAPAPRYTSYPTIVDWKDAFDPPRYREVLARGAASADPFSVYVHVPFCPVRCLFCGCNVAITRSEERRERYAAALSRELAEVAASGIGARPVAEVHWGGGTPTELGLARVARLQREILAAFPRGAPAAGIEVDPRRVGAADVAELAAAGFRRISFGVQDLDPDVQAAIRRFHTPEEVRAAFEAARASGFRSVNLDLMVGLPRQSAAGFRRTIERVLELRPDRIALFQYAHVPWLKKHQVALERLPSPGRDERVRISCEAAGALEAAGYVPIGFDHFALPDDELARARAEGRLGRNFMGFVASSARDLVALGASAIGEVAGNYVQNAPDERDYVAAIERDGLACVKGCELDEDDRLRRDVVHSLLCNGEVPKRALEAAHGIDFDETFRAELARLAPMAADGLVSLDGERVAIAPQGRLLSRTVAAVFDRYRAPTAASGPTFSRVL